MGEIKKGISKNLDAGCLKITLGAAILPGNTFTMFCKFAAALYESDDECPDADGIVLWNAMQDTAAQLSRMAQCGATKEKEELRAKMERLNGAVIQSHKGAGILSPAESAAYALLWLAKIADREPDEKKQLAAVSRFFSAIKLSLDIQKAVGETGAREAFYTEAAVRFVDACMVKR